MKQYFTGVFTAVCLTASVFLFMGSQNKNLGDIEVNSITVITPDGKKAAAWFGVTEEGGGFMKFYNTSDKRDGESTAWIGTKVSEHAGQYGTIGVKSHRRNRGWSKSGMSK
jgi:hypothetical protein